MASGRSDSSSKGGAERLHPRVLAVQYWGAGSSERTADYKNPRVRTLLMFLSLPLSYLWCPGYFLKMKTEDNRDGPSSESQRLPCLSTALLSTNPRCVSLERGNYGGKGNREPVCCWRRSLKPQDEFMYLGNLYWVPVTPVSALFKLQGTWHQISYLQAWALVQFLQWVQWTLLCVEGLLWGWRVWDLEACPRNWMLFEDFWKTSLTEIFWHKTHANSGLSPKSATRASMYLMCLVYQSVSWEVTYGIPSSWFWDLTCFRHSQHTTPQRRVLCLVARSALVVSTARNPTLGPALWPTVAQSHFTADLFTQMSSPVQTQRGRVPLPCSFSESLPECQVTAALGLTTSSDQTVGQEQWDYLIWRVWGTVWPRMWQSRSATNNFSFLYCEFWNRCN